MCVVPMRTYQIYKVETENHIQAIAVVRSATLFGLKALIVVDLLNISSALHLFRLRKICYSGWHNSRLNGKWIWSPLPVRIPARERFQWVNYPSSEYRIRCFLNRWNSFFGHIPQMLNWMLRLISGSGIWSFGDGIFSKGSIYYIIYWKTAIYIIIGCFFRFFLQSKFGPGFLRLSSLII